MRMFLLAAAILCLPVSGCLAAKVVTVPVSLAGDAIEATGKGVLHVGGAAVRVTGDALDGPDEQVRLSLTYRQGTRTRTETRLIKAKHLERELDKAGRKGRLVDVLVEPAG